MNLSETAMRLFLCLAQLVRFLRWDLDLMRVGARIQ